MQQKARYSYLERILIYWWGIKNDICCYMIHIKILILVFHFVNQITEPS